MKTAIYARVSTTSGKQGPEMQLRELRDYCARRGWKIVDEYVDRGVSGARDSRPQLNRLMKDAKRRRFDVVAVWKLDRFARSTKHLLTALDEFSSLGISFVSLQDSWDTSTPQGRLTFTIVGAMAEFERELIRERVRAGIAAARARGVKLGRPRTPVDRTEVRRLRARGLSWYKIAAATGIPRTILMRASA